MKIYSSSQLDEIVRELKNGKTVAFGTDTVFGLACSIKNPEAIDKIYKIKKRDYHKKLPMMFSCVEMMGKYVNIPQKANILISTFSPGPITYILESLDNKSSIACRIPNDEWIIKLLEKYNEPIYVTSANISGQAPLYKYDDVINTLKDIDIVVKKDALGQGASTIVDVVNNYQILRDGPITKEQIEKIII